MTVADSGPGVDAKLSDQIFEPFFTTKSNGMGLGLSICKSIIEAHGGRLTVASASLAGRRSGQNCPDTDEITQVDPRGRFLIRRLLARPNLL